MRERRGQRVRDADNEEEARAARKRRGQRGSGYLTQARDERAMAGWAGWAGWAGSCVRTRWRRMAGPETVRRRRVTRKGWTRRGMKRGATSMR
jgi:hypothetical protein